MSALYDRRETTGQVEYEFHCVPVMSWILLAAIALSLMPRGNQTDRALVGTALLFLLWMLGLAPAWMEIQRAMNRGGVMVSGSKFSFSHPFRVVIPKAR